MATLPRMKMLPINRVLAMLCALLPWLVGPAPVRLAAAPARKPTRPNIVYILADDRGLGGVSGYNSKSAWLTPQLDRLAREGMVFPDAHSASSLCTPSRYALLTGRYAWRGALKRGVSRGYSPPLIEAGRLTVPALLRTHGYTTAMLGKWHLGLDWARSGPSPEDVDFAKTFADGPTPHGFDRFFGLSAALDMPPYVWLENDRAGSLPTGPIGDSPTPKYQAGSQHARHRADEHAVRGLAADGVDERFAGMIFHRHPSPQTNKHNYEPIET